MSIWIHGEKFPCQLEAVQRLKTASGAPLQIRRGLPSGVSTTTDIMRRAKNRRDLVDLSMFGTGIDRESLPSVRQHGAVQDVLQAGLEVAVEVGQHQHARRLLRTTSQCVPG
jgi:hypothetical protein